MLYSLKISILFQKIVSLRSQSVHHLIINPIIILFIGREHSKVEARQFSSGCQDNFAIFAFLAFLLTVLDLVLEMQGGAAGGGKRRKRSDLSQLSFIGNEDGRNATLVSYALFRGFMNSIDADSYHCKVKYICEGAEESLKYGHLAPKIINLTRYSCFESLSILMKYFFRHS